MLSTVPPTQQQRLGVRERPEHAPVMYMRWEQLLFLHWACDPADLQRKLPPGLFVDTFDGRAWVGIVPLLMRDVRPIGLPPMRWISDFLELNVRTYVYDARGVPGVWFYSLDCNQPVAVEAAKRLFHLNYQHAEMDVRIEPASGEVFYRSRRHDSPQESRFRYRAVGDAHEAAPDSLEFFLIERYVLFAYDDARERVGAGRVSHPPYEICGAEAPEWDEVMLELNGFPPFRRSPDHVCATRAQEVAATRMVFE